MKNWFSVIAGTILLGLTLPVTPLHSQDWFEWMDDPTLNFYEIQRRFNQYWEGKTPERGTGWKQFKRWEYFWEERTYPTGNFPERDITYKEFQRYKQMHPDFDASSSNWTPLGPFNWQSTSYNPGIGRVNCITVHPSNSNIIFLGAPSGGIWKSTNGGLNWTTNTDNLVVIGVSAIVINPSNPNVLYMATGDGDGGATYSIGILKSTDGGNTWSATGLNWPVSQAVRINKLMMHPSNPDILLAGANTGFYRTIDGGANWTQIMGGNFRDIEFNPANPDIVYAAGTQFFRSTNNGQTLVQINNGIPTSGMNRIAIGVSPANPNYVYLLAGSSANSGFFGFFRSIDNGQNFTMQSNSPNILGYAIDGSSSGGQSSYDLAVAVSPTNPNEVYSGGINVWKSTNGGVNWTIVSYWVWPNSTGYTHADIHSLDFYGSVLYCGSDGGIFKTTNGGLNWTDLTAGVAITQWYRIGGTPQNADLIYGGCQDNGSFRYNSGVWTHVLGADGMEAAIDYTNSNTVYACIQNGGLRRSFNGGNSFSSITSGISGSGNWVTPYMLDPVVPTTLYAGFQDIWKSTNQGTSWTQLSTFNGSTIRQLDVSKSNQNYIYFSAGSSVFRTTDGGTTWNNISSGLPGLAIPYIIIHPANPDRAWVTTSGYTAGMKVFYTSNGGANWTNISGSLPNVPANCIVYETGSPDRLYVGMDVGVYYRDSSMSDWAAFMNGLPNVIVRELEIHYGTGKIRAATYGRGLWESPLAVIGIKPIAGNIPDKFRLYQNYPNPFNPKTKIRFDISPVETGLRPVFARLTVYDILGREIAVLVNENLQPGSYEIQWDASQYSSGAYYYELRAGGFVETRKMTLVK